MRRTILVVALAACGGSPQKQQQAREQLGPVIGQTHASAGPQDPSRPAPDAPGVPPVDQPLPEQPKPPALPDDTGPIPHDGAGPGGMH
jgi:hypothetical protein